MKKTEERYHILCNDFVNMLNGKKLMPEKLIAEAEEILEKKEDLLEYQVSYLQDTLIPNCREKSDKEISDEINAEINAELI